MNTTGTFYHSEHCALMNQSGFLSSNGTEEPIAYDGVVAVYIHGCKFTTTVSCIKLRSFIDSVELRSFNFSSIKLRSFNLLRSFNVGSIKLRSFNFSSIKIRRLNFSSDLELSGMTIINSYFSVQFYLSKGYFGTKHHHQISMRYYCIKL